MCTYGINEYNLLLEQNLHIDTIVMIVSSKINIRCILKKSETKQYVRIKPINFTFDIHKFKKIPNQIDNLIYRTLNSKFDDVSLFNNLPSELKCLDIYSKFDNIYNLESLPINLNHLILCCNTNLNNLPENLKMLEINKTKAYEFEKFVNLPQGLKYISTICENYDSTQSLMLNYQTDYNNLANIFSLLIQSPIYEKEHYIISKSFNKWVLIV